MDPVTVNTLDRGRKNTRLLVQPQYSPMPVEHQIAVLYCGTNGLMKDISIDKVNEFEKQLVSALESENVYDSLRKGVLDDTVAEKIKNTAARIVTQLK